MPIDLDRVVGAELPAGTASWDADDVILYHLGAGAGAPPDDAGELEYAFEGKLKVLPSFAVVPVFGALFGLTQLEGLDVNLAMLLHGEQDIEGHLASIAERRNRKALPDDNTDNIRRQRRVTGESGTPMHIESP